MPRNNPESPGVKPAGLVLDYDTPAPAPGALTLEELNGCVRVIFPVAPKWAYILTIVYLFFVGATKVIFGVYAVVIIRDLWHSPSRTSPSDAIERRAILQIIVGVGISVAVWWGLAGCKLWEYRRWGRVPRILTASKDALILTRLGFWKMRERSWAAVEITSIELKPIKGNLNRKRTLASLRVNRLNGRRLYFRLSSRDALLPGRIAEKLALTLGCPLASAG
jgi:hypothetical protein